MQAQMPPPPPPMVLIPGLPALPPIPPKYMKKVQKMFMQAMKYGVEYYESSGSEDTCGGDRTPREIMTGMPIKEGCKTVSFEDFFVSKKFKFTFFLVAASEVAAADITLVSVAVFPLSATATAAHVHNVSSSC